jgi:hypothetical protein
VCLCVNAALQAIEIIVKANAEHPQWEVDIEFGHIDDYHNIIPMLVDLHSGLDQFRWYIDPEVQPCLPLVFCVCRAC